MKLSELYESHFPVKSSLSFYGDPKNPVTKSLKHDMSILTGGTKDRARFLKSMNKPAKKRKKRKKRKKGKK